MLKFFSRIASVVIYVIIFCVSFILASLPYDFINALPNNMYTSYEEVCSANKEKMLGRYLSLELDDSVATVSTTSEVDTSKLNIKLFNLVTIKEVDVNLIHNNEVTAGGNALGFALKCNGVIIVGFNDVITKEGCVNPFKETNFKIGDRIASVNGVKVSNMQDIDELLFRTEYAGEPLEIVAYRNGNEIAGSVTPAKEYVTNRYKLGIWVREDATGVGTLTFVRKDNGRFGALGHGICEGDSDECMQIVGGEIYECDIIGVNKGERGKTGELRGLFVAGKNEQGVVDKNNKYGVFGNIDTGSSLNNGATYKIGGRLTAKPGKAKILTCLSGGVVDEYDIEIIKTNYQKNSSDRSMVIKVTDKRLLEKTGGIVQGMSGSPIIQDGKIIGAVTHVFVNDPTRGFGIYIDWMLNN